MIKCNVENANNKRLELENVGIQDNNEKSALKNTTENLLTTIPMSQRYANMLVYIKFHPYMKMAHSLNHSQI